MAAFAKSWRREWVCAAIGEAEPAVTRYVTRGAEALSPIDTSL
jgi:hypothetical protein